MDAKLLKKHYETRLKGLGNTLNKKINKLKEKLENKNELLKSLKKKSINKQKYILTLEVEEGFLEKHCQGNVWVLSIKTKN